jgi:ribosomal protein S18 acetylase RimI-like enzyme
MPTNPMSWDPALVGHHPPPRADGLVAVTITHLELTRADWTQRGPAPEISVVVTREPNPSVALYREIYDSVGRPWLWYERKLMSDEALAALLGRPDHELHVARHHSELVGYFELGDSELVFFGLTPAYIGRRIGPWLLDRAIERAFANGIAKLRLNTNTLDHPRALDTYRKAGFRVVRTKDKELKDARVLWPDLYRWQAR